MNNLERVIVMFRPNSEGISEWIKRDMIMKSDLGKNWGNGVMRYGVAFSVGKYIWEAKRKNGNPRGRIEALRTNGLTEESNMKRPIREDIRTGVLQRDGSCVVCGSKNNLIIDHKNHLYNDERVLQVSTQVIDDFQVLCNHCNLQKRQTSVIERRDGVRYSAMNIPSLSVYGVDYLRGDGSFDINDVDTMVGTYWYDPVAFHRGIIEKFSE